ncbi:MAG TPA: class I SAM-dependent methyltransferase [Gemmatimonadaceae bacterium]|nr:class I SAM-dependent methyltransferase [Gemmatimonadaceae bacterium]
MSSTRVPPVPAVLRLVQRAVLGRWRATGEDLYREVARIAEAGPAREILVSGCGTGVAAEWLAARTGASVTGVDPDPESITRAEAHARELEQRQLLHYEQAPLDDLPHEDEMFDIAIGEPPLSAAADPQRAVSELVRVTKPMGSIILLQPSWTSEIPSDSRDLIVERLGLQPFLLVRWKQMLRDAGVVELQVQDWTSGSPGGRGSSGADTNGETPRFNLRQKAQIIGRAWRRWGFGAARGAVERETTLIRELSRERTIGLQLIKGVKWPHEKES